MSRWRTVLLLCAVTAWTGCGAEREEPPADETASSTRLIADDDLLLRVSVESRTVEFGKAFPLTVVRAWSKALEPGDWDDAVLAPLVVRLATIEHHEDDRHVEETRHYDCYAFGLDQVTLPAIPFKATPRNGGPERVVASAPVELRVTSALVANSSQVAELPGEPLRIPGRWRLLSWPSALLLVALLALLWFLWARRRGHARNIAQLSPQARASERLLRLRELLPLAPDDTQPYYVEVSALVRDFIEERFSLRAQGMTTEEFVVSSGVAATLPGSRRTLLAEFLASCDRVKFAHHAPDPTAHERTFAAAENLVRETSLHAEAEPAASGAGGQAT